MDLKLLAFCGSAALVALEEGGGRAQCGLHSRCRCYRKRKENFRPIRTWKYGLSSRRVWLSSMMSRTLCTRRPLRCCSSLQEQIANIYFYISGRGSTCSKLGCPVLRNRTSQPNTVYAHLILK